MSIEVLSVLLSVHMDLYKSVHWTHTMYRDCVVSFWIELCVYSLSISPAYCVFLSFPLNLRVFSVQFPILLPHAILYKVHVSTSVLLRICIQVLTEHIVCRRRKRHILNRFLGCLSLSLTLCIPFSVFSISIRLSRLWSVVSFCKVISSWY